MWRSRVYSANRRLSRFELCQRLRWLLRLCRRFSKKKRSKAALKCEEGFQLGTTNGYRLNGAGHAIIFESGGKRYCASRTFAPDFDETGKDPIMMQRKIALYCWNGVYKGDAVYTYRVSDED